MIPPSTGGAWAEMHEAAWLVGYGVVGFRAGAGCTTGFGLGAIQTTMTGGVVKLVSEAVGLEGGSNDIAYLEPPTLPLDRISGIKHIRVDVLLVDVFVIELMDGDNL